MFKFSMLDARFCLLTYFTAPVTYGDLLEGYRKWKTDQQYNSSYGKKEHEGHEAHRILNTYVDCISVNSR